MGLQQVGIGIPGGTGNSPWSSEARITGAGPGRLPWSPCTLEAWRRTGGESMLARKGLPGSVRIIDSRPNQSSVSAPFQLWRGVPCTRCSPPNRRQKAPGRSVEA